MAATHDAAGDEVQAFCRASQFRLPDDPRTPLVMVGAGAGVAPLRAFVQEREAMVCSVVRCMRPLTQRLGGQVAAGEVLGDAVLYFGCMHAEKDYLYRSEFEAAVESGALTALRPAFFEQPQDVRCTSARESVVSDLLLGAGDTGR